MREDHDYQVTFDPKTGVHTWIAPNGRTYPVGPDHDLSLTADHDNPHPSLYRQPPLPDTTTDQTTPADDQEPDTKQTGDKEVDDPTQAMLDALIRKYGKESA
jgi:hypothetical protein